MDDVEISPATEAEATALLERSKETYVESLQVRRGLSPQEARAKADADTDGAIALYSALGFQVIAQQMTLPLTER